MKDTVKLQLQKEVYFKIVHAAEANTLAELQGNFFRQLTTVVALMWHNTDGLFRDLTREESLGAIYIGQDRAHQRLGLKNWHKEKLERTIKSRQ